MSRGQQKQPTPSYAKLFQNHPWLAHFLVNVVKRILAIIIDCIDSEAKPYTKTK